MSVRERESDCWMPTKQRMSERTKESRFSRMLPSIFNQRVTTSDMHSEREKELKAHTLYVLQQI